MEVISHEKNVYLIINLDCFSFTLGQGLMDIILWKQGQDFKMSAAANSG